MNNSNYNFWKMAFDMRAIDVSILRQAVVTELNPFGELTEDEFKEISGVDFEVKENKPIEPNQTAPVQPADKLNTEHDLNNSTETVTAPQA